MMAFFPLIVLSTLDVLTSRCKVSSVCYLLCHLQWTYLDQKFSLPHQIAVPLFSLTDTYIHIYIYLFIYVCMYNRTVVLMSWVCWLVTDREEGGAERHRKSTIHSNI